MTRTPIKINTAAPPQWHGREGWIVERKPGDYYLVDLKGGGQGVFHDKELDREPEAPAEPTTATVMVGHCPVTVPASTVAQRSAMMGHAAWPAYSKDYQAGYRDGYAAAQAAARKPISWATDPFQKVQAQQASDFERIVSMERKTDRD